MSLTKMRQLGDDRRCHAYCSRCGYRSHNQLSNKCPAKNHVCKQCGKNGHFEQQCIACPKVSTRKRLASEGVTIRQEKLQKVDDRQFRDDEVLHQEKSVEMAKTEANYRKPVLAPEASSSFQPKFPPSAPKKLNRKSSPLPKKISEEKKFSATVSQTSLQRSFSRTDTTERKLLQDRIFGNKIQKAFLRTKISTAKALPDESQPTATIMASKEVNNNQINADQLSPKPSAAIDEQTILLKDEIKIEITEIDIISSDSDPDEHPYEKPHHPASMSSFFETFVE